MGRLEGVAVDIRPRLVTADELEKAYP
jgi:hypothetical protein